MTADLSKPALLKLALHCPCESKPWGSELLWANAAHYSAKFLLVRADCSLSLQFHRRKEETMLCLEGSGILLLGRRAIPVRPGTIVHVPPLTPHRLSAMSYLTILEVSTSQLQDVVRLSDDYRRDADPAVGVEHGTLGPEFVESCQSGRNQHAPAEYKRTMARENRLATIAIMLASGERLRASDLASRFGVSERTIYRDMQRLTDQGFPLAAIPGPNGGYAIFGEAGARQISLELDEAVALAIGAGLASRLVGGSDGGAAQRALKKIQAAMPDAACFSLPQMIGLFAEEDENHSPRRIRNHH
jgi:mannose-6-phosphate isomerase-like protein (cupin superfamily)